MDIRIEREMKRGKKGIFKLFPRMITSLAVDEDGYTKHYYIPSDMARVLAEIIKKQQYIIDTATKQMYETSPSFRNPGFPAKKTFTIDWSASQGGNIIDEQGKDVNDKDHICFKMFGIIFKYSAHPAKFTTQQLVDWVNQGVEDFGLLTFKKMIERLESDSIK